MKTAHDVAGIRQFFIDPLDVGVAGVRIEPMLRSRSERIKFNLKGSIMRPTILRAGTWNNSGGKATSGTKGRLAALIRL